MTLYRNVVENGRPGTILRYHVFYTTEPVPQGTSRLQVHGFTLLVSRKVRTGESAFSDASINIGIEHHERIPYSLNPNATTIKLDIFYGVIDYLAELIVNRDTPSVAVCKGISSHAYSGGGIGKYASRFGNVTMVYQIYKYLVDALSIPDSATLQMGSYTVGDFRRAMRGTDEFSFMLPLDL